MNPMFRLVKIFFFIPAALITLPLFKLFFWDVPLLARINPGKTAFMTLSARPVESTWVPLSRVSPHLARSVVAAEDARFYEHGGADWKALRESLEKNAAEKEFVRGGSTITMQLAKNLYLTPNKNVARKALEILIALKMDADLTKERVLEIYLNVIEWGEGLYGAEAASRHYFHKSAAELSAGEAAYLAAIIPNPVKWGRTPPGPYVRRRAATMLSRMKSAPAPDLSRLVTAFGRPVSEDAVRSKPVAAAVPSRPVPATTVKTVAVAPPVEAEAKDSAPQNAAPVATPDPKEFFLDDE